MGLYKAARLRSWHPHQLAEWSWRNRPLLKRCPKAQAACASSGEAGSLRARRTASCHLSCFNSHSGRYLRAAGKCVAKGFAVSALDDPKELAGFICEDFARRAPAPDFAVAVIKGISHLTPHAQVLRLKNEDFSRDPARVKHLNEDPLIAHEVQPTRTVAALVRPTGG